MGFKKRSNKIDSVALSDQFLIIAGGGGNVDSFKSCHELLESEINTINFTFGGAEFKPERLARLLINPVVNISFVIAT